MSTKKLICAFCKNEFDKAQKEINRQMKQGRTLDSFYCSITCARYHNHSSRSKEEKEKIYNKVSTSLKGNTNGKKGDFTRVLNSLRKREKEHEMSEEYLLELWKKQHGKCAISNVDIIHPKNIKSKHPLNASLDRIDSSNGYVKDNVQFVAYSINLAKNDFSAQLFEDFWEQIKSKVV